MEKAKHKITKQPYSYECADNCCSEFGYIWTVNGKEVYRGPGEDEAIICILTELGVQVEIVGLEEQSGEEVWELDNYDTILD